MRFFSLASAMVLAVAPFSLASAQQTQPINPRDVATQVAQAVDDNYFDAARGHTIADGLRSRAQSGEFDHDTNPLDLATALSAYLHPFDGHFTVVYRPNGGLLPAGPTLVPNVGPHSPVALQNYGFAHTEMLPGGIGYIQITQFSPIDPRSPNDPAKLAADSALQSVANARAIIFDLRDSHGGAPAMVAYLVSHFVPADAQIYNTFHGRIGTITEAPIVDPGPRRLDVPLYVLVNGGSGSASESFPYTLQAAHRAVIVGEPSNGRANPGGFLPISGGFAVFVSRGSPVNPITHTNWEGTGVIPDIASPSTDALQRAHEAALQHLLDANTQGPDANELRWLLADIHAAAPALSSQGLQAYAGGYGEEANITVDNGSLVLHQGRRASTLRSVSTDLFVSTLDPMIHAQFERQGRRVVAFTLLTPTGPVARFTRAP